MIKKRQQYSASFKAKVALEAIREDSTLSQLSSKYQINANVISKWKKQALEGLDSLFSSKHEAAHRFHTRLGKTGIIAGKEADMIGEPYAEMVQSEERRRRIVLGRLMRDWEECGFMYAGATASFSVFPRSARQR